MSTDRGIKPPPGPKGGGSGGKGPAPESGGKGEYRGGLFDQLDIPAVTSFLVCGLLFFLAIAGIKSVDYSSLDKRTLEDMPDRIARIIMPLKPPGKPVSKESRIPKLPGRSAEGGKPGDGGDASAAARIERSRRTVNEQVEQAQERITKAAVLSILSGKGPGTRGASTSGAAVAKGRSLVDFGGLEDKLANLEGLTKFDAKSGSNNGDGKPSGTREDAIGTQSGIDKIVKGFQNAKMGALSKIGVTEFEKPELLERNSKYKGDRSMSDVGAFISKKQHMVTMLYEERLKVNPTLEGKVTVVIVIEEDGTVSSATVLKSETTLDDPDFQSDLLRRIRRWIFPPSTGGPVEMKSPFVFKPA